MKLRDFESLSIDELWACREKITAALTARLVAEMRVLENRLDELGRNLAPRVALIPFDLSLSIKKRLVGIKIVILLI